MKNTILIIVILLWTPIILFGQKVKSPKTIDEAIEILKTDCPESLQQIIKKTSNDSLINLCYPWDGDYKTIFEWTEKDNKKSKIKKYLNDKGIESNQHQQTVIMIAFKYFLNKQTIDESKIFEPFKKIEDKWRAEDKVRYSTDTLRGVYIPKDLEDCFKQIDSFWNDTVKNEVRTMTSSEFGGNTHFGIGLWMRNNWQLWGGSRLSKYMNDLGIYHPDNMSGTILSLYYKYLTEEEFDLAKEIEKIKEQRSKVAPDFKSDYELDTTVKFQYVRDAAYGYTFATPLTFMEQIDTKGQVDSIVFYSKDKEAKLIYFVDGDIHRQDTSKNYLYEYFHKLETGQQPILKNCKTLKSQLRYDNKWLNYRGYFVALGQLNDKQFIWKTQLSEVPISGDLTYKTMLFIYPIERQSYYQPIGVSLADNFRDLLK